MYWFNNDRYGRYKLINKIDNVIALLAHCFGLNLNDFLVKFQVQNVLSVHKMQSLLLMNDISHNKVYLPYIHVTTNNTVHGHFTRSNCNLHIPQLSTVDKRNFIYYAMLNWNACLYVVKLLLRHKFYKYCKTVYL